MTGISRREIPDRVPVISGTAAVAYALRPPSFNSAIRSSSRLISRMTE
jgi:hypothetical protein